MLIECPTCNSQNRKNFILIDKIYVCRICEKERVEIFRKQAKEKAARYYAANKEKILARNKKWMDENSDKEKATAKKYRKNNKEHITNRIKKWRLNNLDRYRKNQREWKRKQRKENPHLTVVERLRRRIGESIRQQNAKKFFRFQDIVGCSYEELIKHIESQFKDGMCWERFSEIEIDHIKPCCSFDLTKEEEQRKCFHYSNLQPLWIWDHQKKSAEDKKLSIKLYSSDV